VPLSFLGLTKSTFVPFMQGFTKDLYVHAMKPHENQYADHFGDYDNMGPAFLGPMLSDTWRNDPKKLGIKLSRYETVSKLLSGKKKVLEIDYGDNWTSKLVCREVGDYYAIDVDILLKFHVEQALKRGQNSRDLQL